MKRCTKCGETKSLEAFGRHDAAWQGVRSECKTCVNEYKRARYAANPGDTKAKSRAWRAANPDKVKKSNQDWYAANRDRASGRGSEWRAANPGRAMSQSRTDAARRSARKYGAEVDSTVTVDDVIALHGSACYICGVETDPAAPPRSRFKAELEHVIPLSRGGAHNLANLRCACHPCNVLKGPWRSPEEIRNMFA